MGAILEYIKMAVNTIRSNKGRSFLTMLGIIIGISSVIMIISIGNGVAGSVTSDLNTIASGQVAIYSRENSNYAAVEFDQDDMDAVKEKVDHVKGVSFTTGMYGKARGPKGEFESYANVGNESQIFSAQEPIIKGRYYTRTDEENKAPVCVLREGAAYLLFGTNDVIGKTIDVTFYGVDMELEIIGIRQDNKSSIVNMMGYFEQVEFEMPLSVYADTFLGGEIYSSNMMIYGDAPEYSAQIAADAKELLETRHKVRGQGVILIEAEGVDEEKLMEDALEAGAVDFLTDDGIYEIRTDPYDCGAISEALAAKGYKFLSAEAAYIPSTYVTLTEQEDMINMNKMLDMFDDNDDIQGVWHNWENTDDAE